MDLELIQAAKIQQQHNLALCRLGASTSLAQSHSAMPMQSTPGVSDQLNSRDAMLVGTIAALQEESSILRNQHKSDVWRLECELQELRSAAATVLPQLRQDGSQLQIESAAGLSPTRSSGLVPRASTLFEPSMRGLPQLDLSQLSALEQSFSHAQSTEKPMPQTNRTTPSFFGNNSRSLLQEAANLQQQVCERAPEQRAASNTAPEQASTSGAPEQGAHIVELYKELERMSLALQQKDQENAKLKEEMETREEAHARDISALEGMLRPLENENKQLTQALEDAYSQIQSMKKGNIDDSVQIQCLKKGNIDDSVLSIHTASTRTEPANEPDVERSPDLDKLYSEEVFAAKLLKMRA